MALGSFNPGMNVAIVGASGGLGRAFTKMLADDPAVARLYALSRSELSAGQRNISQIGIELTDEQSVADAAARIQSETATLDLVIVASGILHTAHGIAPEKTWRTLSLPAMEEIFRVNTFGPAMIAKHFLPLLPKDRKSVFAAISARVGSITDNQLGGWYSYRASKAALNMLIRGFAIELERTNRFAACIGLHPGTVDTSLSKPFQANVPDNQLFSPTRSAAYLLDVIDTVAPQDSGRVFAWDRSEVPA